MKKVLVCVVVFIGLFAFAMTGIAQAEPTLIGATCITQGDKATLAYERAKCDQDAEFEGYNNGFLRPCNPSDGLCDLIIKCLAPPSGETHKVYMCFGVPWN